jgi:DNA-binding NarL/FixJ family response regulator
MEANTKVLISVLSKDAKLLSSLRNTVTKSNRYRIEKEFKILEDFNSNIHLLKSKIFVLDDNLIDSCYLEYFKKIKTLRNNCSILIAVDDVNNALIFRAVRLGAHGYLLKTDSPENIIEFLDDVIKGGGKMPYRLINKILEFFEDIFLIPTDVKLSSREKQIICLMQKGMVCKEIASSLFLSPATIRTHIRNIRAKQKQTK